MLLEYPAFRKSISKSLLQELAFIDDSALRQNLWEEAKAGKLTIRGLRETKKSSVATDGQGRKPMPAATTAADVAKLLASVQKNIKRTSIDIVALRQRKATLDDKQREVIRSLRNQLNDLLGD